MTRTEFTSIWPPLPIIIRDMVDWRMPEDYDFDAAIVHPNRVCEINLHRLQSSQFQRFASAMQEQFPALRHLTLGCIDGFYRAPALPNQFLGGSAPGLQSLELRSIPFPALPKLLLSATDLVSLTLCDIPHSGYILPEAIATCLAELANLEYFTIGFESPLSRPDLEGRRPPPPTRTILPALTRFVFKGASEYLEDLVARIDTPLLDFIWITFFNDLIFDLPRLAQFTRRTTTLPVLDKVYVGFDDYGVQVGYFPLQRILDEASGLRISCRELGWQLSSVAQVFTSFFPSIYMVKHLYINGPGHLSGEWLDDIENMRWLEIFHPFTAVKNLHLSMLFTECIAPALQNLVGERVTDVLPALENIFLELEEPQPWGPPDIRDGIDTFIAARHEHSHPIAVHWLG